MRCARAQANGLGAAEEGERAIVGEGPPAAPEAPEPAPALTPEHEIGIMRV